MKLSGILRSTVAGAALAAMAILPIAGAVTVLSADAAYANNGNGNGNGGGNGGGNGNGNGNGGANRNDSAAGQSASAQRNGRPAGQPGRRGELASALGAMNAAHANQRALENASPNSMPGRLYTYQQTGGIDAQQITQYQAAQQTYTQLSQLTPAQVLAVYDANADGILDATEQAQYQTDLTAAQTTVNTYSAAYTALAGLSQDGQLNLTADALDELNSLLGL